MIRLGLTGSIGMGKSTTADMFRARGVPVIDADAIVHELYRGDAVPQIERAFPGTTEGGIVDRRLLADRLVAEPETLAVLESIVHPLVWQREQEALARAEESGADVVVLDIPLLYENGAEQRVDKVLVVTADPETQRARVLARPGMTEDKFAMILSRQVPDAEKRRRADFIIDTGRGLDEARRNVDEILATLKN